MTAAPLQPNPKAASTAQHSQLSALAGSTPTTSRAASPARQRRHVRQESSNSEYLSEKATTGLIRRTLIAEGHGIDKTSSNGIDGLLPPLTSSNDVDLQLYAIISIVVKDFINPWYTKITPDQTFVEEVIQIIAHCSRALEQRLRQLDLPELALNDLPSVLCRHVNGELDRVKYVSHVKYILDFRKATETAGDFSYGKEPRLVYHALNPHPALDPGLCEEDRASAEQCYRQLLVQGALAVLLPTEDLQNSSLRILVTDIIADLILGRAIDDKLCHGWFLHEMVSKITTIISSRTQPKLTGAELQNDAKSRLEKFGLLSSEDEGAPGDSHLSSRTRSTSWFWTILQWIYITVIFVRFTIVGLLQARRGQPRKYYISLASSPNLTTAKRKAQEAIVVLDYSIFATVATLLDLPSRMPWLVGTLAFGRHCLMFGRSNARGLRAVLDR
jgi:hypothetical protein